MRFPAGKSSPLLHASALPPLPHPALVLTEREGGEGESSELSGTCKAGKYYAMTR